MASTGAVTLGEVLARGEAPPPGAILRAGFTEEGRTAAALSSLAERRGFRGRAEGLVRSLVGAADPDLAASGLARFAQAYEEAAHAPYPFPPSGAETLVGLFGASAWLGRVAARWPRETLENLELPPGTPPPLLERGEGLEAYGLRLRRWRTWEVFRIARRDLLGSAGVEEVTGWLSTTADAALEGSVRAASQGSVAEMGGLEASPPPFVVLALGKLGGRELNFSSDVDVVFLFGGDPAAPTRKGRTAGELFGRIAERVVRLMSEVTEEGFVFRVDTNLRPLGRQGPLACSVRSALDYYEGWGETWERAALLKARPAAGAVALGEEFLAGLSSFVFRKHLDFSTIEDLREMKDEVDRALDRLGRESWNVKLGKGGIREIEFAAQALVLIHGGRVPAVRRRGTLEMLQALRGEGLLPEEEAERLAQAYRFFRRVEHRIQMFEDRQTQAVPTGMEALRRLARSMGYAEGPPFLGALEGHRAHVQETFDRLFQAPARHLAVAPATTDLLENSSTTEALADRLQALGFRNASGAAEALERIRRPVWLEYGRRAERIWRRVTPLLVEEALAGADPEGALILLDRFLSRIGSRRSFYALLAENPPTARFLMKLFGSSEFLGKLLIDHPELLDTLLVGGAAGEERPPEELRSELDRSLEAVGDDEGKRDALRRFHHVETLRVGIGDLAGQIPFEGVRRALTHLAEAILEGALRVAWGEVLRSRPGPPPPRGFAVVALGKLGARALSYGSDLDLIFLYDLGEGASEGSPPTGWSPQEPQAGHEFYARVAQRLISVLSLPTREGIAYALDLRLRPSGRQGPLVTSLDGFRRYHEREAAGWERQALVKARAVAGDPRLRVEVERALGEVVYGRPFEEAQVGEMDQMRGRMEEEVAREGGGHYNLKLGRGGLVDVEFVVQLLQLRHGPQRAEVRTPSTMEAIDRLEHAGVVAPREATTLGEAYRFLSELEDRLRITQDRSTSDLASEEDWERAARRMGSPPARAPSPGRALKERYVEWTDRVRAVYRTHFAPGAERKGDR